MRRRLDTFSFRRNLHADRDARPAVTLAWSSEPEANRAVCHIARDAGGDRVGAVYSEQGRLFALVAVADFSIPARVLEGSCPLNPVGLIAAKAAVEAAVAAAKQSEVA